MDLPLLFLYNSMGSGAAMAQTEATEMVTTNKIWFSSMTVLPSWNPVRDSGY